MMTELPRKRMRLFQSVEVDEDNPDYLRDKQKAEAVLRNKFENIFAKYENMPESKSDEIDMLTGDIVVDRGHIRSLQRNKRTWEAAQFLGDLMGDRIGDTFEELDNDSEDELAPSEASESPEAVERGQRKPKAQGSHASSDHLPIREETREETTEIPINSAQVPSPLILDQNQLLNALNPALQLAQLPQAQFNPENQNALLMGLGRVVLQAVTQILPVALSNHLGATSGAIAPQPAIAPANNCLPTPATDPKWAYPPLPQLPYSSDFAHSSPIPNSTNVRRKRKAFETGQSGRPAKKCVDSTSRPRVSAQRPPATTTIITSPQEDEHIPEESDFQDSPMSNLPFSTPQYKYTSHTRKYFFNERDNEYIIAQRTVHEQSFRQIRNSRKDWRRYPVSALVSHWNYHLKRRTLQAAEPATNVSGEVIEQRDRENEVDQTPTLRSVIQPISKPRKRGRPPKVPLTFDADPLRQQPTPAATENSDLIKELQDSTEEQMDSNNDLHNTYSQEDLELLSLAGDEQEGGDDSMEAEDILDTSISLEDPVLISTETDSPSTDVGEEDSVVAPCPTKQAQHHSRVTTAADICNATTTSESSTWKRKKLNHINYVVDSDYEDEDEVEDEDEDDLILVPTCEPESRAISSSTHHLPNELNRTPTPEIKREPSTPRPVSLLIASSPTMPIVVHSSTVKDGSKLSKSEMSRRVRAQWAKWGRAKPSPAVRQRSNLQILKRKLDEDSDDELA